MREVCMPSSSVSSQHAGSPIRVMLVCDPVRALVEECMGAGLASWSFWSRPPSSSPATGAIPPPERVDRRGGRMLHLLLIGLGDLLRAIGHATHLSFLL